MKKTLILASALACVLIARDNPFAPTDINATSIVVSNVIEEAPPFKGQNFHFPSDARELREVVLNYRAMDGSMRQKILEINASVDWRDEFVLDVHETPKKTASKKLDVSVTGAPSAMPDAPEQPSVAKAIVEAVDMNKSGVSSNLNATGAGKSASSNLKSAASFEFAGRIKFELKGKDVVVATKDNMKRHFLDKPTKLALDFAKNGKDYSTRTTNVAKPPLKKAIFGSHGKFYRVVLDLDKPHKYSVEKTATGYIIRLK